MAVDDDQAIRDKERQAGRVKRPRTDATSNDDSSDAPMLTEEQIKQFEAALMRAPVVPLPDEDVYDL